MKYSLAVFDMDGTILDTLQDLTDSINHALSACGYPEHSIDEVRFFVGNGIDKLVERALPADMATGTDPDGGPGPNGGSSPDGNTGTCKRDALDEAKACVKAEFMSYYRVHSADKTGPYAGITELLRKLREAGIKTAVVSNKPDVAVKDLVVKYFDGLFDAAVGDMEGQRVKPAPDMCNKIFRELGMGPEGAVYIGDSDTDMLTARNSGLDEILVSWGFRGRTFLEEHGAKCICDTPEEVYDTIVGK